MARADLADEIAAVGGLCRGLGLGEVAPLLLRAAHRTTFHLVPLPLVARVQSAEPARHAWQTAAREVAVAAYLGKSGAPVAIPALPPLAGPHVTVAGIVTLWPFAEACAADDVDVALAASTLDAVHRSLRGYPGDLPPFTRTLDRCWDVLTAGDAGAILSSGDRDVLMRQFRRLREVVEASIEHVPLHGDVHLGKLLLTPAGPRWTDFEEACRGPRELDIAGLPPAAWPYFDTAHRRLVEQCADLKSVCVAVWCAADPARSIEVAAAAAYHLARARRMTG